MQHLLNGVTAVGDSDVLSVASISRGSYRIAKVNITGGTASVTLKGRMGPDDSTWTTLQTWTASGMNAIVLPPQVKFSVDSISGATVHAFLDAYEK